MRAGDFSELLDPNNPFINRKNSAGNKIPVYVADPASAASSQCGKEIPAGSGTISTSACIQDLWQAARSNPQDLNITQLNRLSTNDTGLMMARTSPNHHPSLV